MDTISTHVIPGILEEEWPEIEKKLNLIRTFSNRIHVDFIDSKFSENTTLLDPSPFSKYANELYLEAHLQVEEPINYLNTLSKAGFKKFLGSIEMMSSQEDFVAKAEFLGEVGLSLNLKSSIDEIKVPFEDLDLILLMTIPANKSGQTFDESSIAKIKELRQKTLVPIEVDGGINNQTIVACRQAGANIFVSTSYVTGSDNPFEQFNTLRSLI